MLSHSAKLFTLPTWTPDPKPVRQCTCHACIGSINRIFTGYHPQGQRLCYFSVFMSLLPHLPTADIAAITILCLQSVHHSAPSTRDQLIRAALQSKWSLSATLDTGSMEESHCPFWTSKDWIRLHHTWLPLSWYRFLNIQLSHTLAILPQFHPLQKGGKRKEKSPQNFALNL